MKTVFEYNDLKSEAFINPEAVVDPVPGFPECIVATFSKDIIQHYAAMEGTKEVARLYSVNCDTPIYSRKINGVETGFYMARTGGPSCVADLEEVIAMGGRKFVFFGCCGILDGKKADGKLIIPVSAVRDEGTSYHYKEASTEICMKERAVNVLENCMAERSYPYVKGKVWTTDAIYRETAELISARKAYGCLGVEMECASLLALTEFRGVSYAQFLFGADSLDGEIWDERDLRGNGADKSDLYMELAFQCAQKL